MMSYPVTPRIHFPKVATRINKNECPLSVESSTLKCTIGAFYGRAELRINPPKKRSMGLNVMMRRICDDGL